MAFAAVPQDSHQENVKAYKDVLDDRERESEAIQLIDGFITQYAQNRERLIEIADAFEIDEGDPVALKKERKKILEQQEDLADLTWLAFKERKRDTEGHRRLWKAAVFALGQMGADGAPFLWKAMDEKRFKKDVDFRALCVAQVGATLDWKQYEELIDLLDYHEDQIIAAAAEALTHYREAPGKIRQEVVKKLVQFLESYYTAQTNPEDSVARQRYRIVRRPMIGALSAITGQASQDPLEWRKWYENNKKDKSLWSDDA